MKPTVLLAQATTPDGAQLTLHERDSRFVIRLAGRELMNSAISASELRLGDLAFSGAVRPKTILIGGLGLGYTLRRVLQLADPDARIIVAELLPAVVEWNRTYLRDLNGSCLDDPRVTVRVESVRQTIACAKPEAYDAILLDVDNGPAAMVSEDNTRLYSERGLERLKKVLTKTGRVAVWSASIDHRFAARFDRSGFRVTTEKVGLHANAKSAPYAIYIGEHPPARAEEPVASPAPLLPRTPYHGGRR